jgi:comEA protein
MKKNLPFIITMSIFIIACAVITAFTINTQPQYIHFTPVQTTTADVDVELININTATLGQLQTLPGIGEEMALRIVEYRERFGHFVFIEEIMKVSGIGQGRFERIRDYIYADID